jgi:GT2 family glycosyltransferase
MASISVLVPTRSRPELLAEALASVARQSHLEMELIVIRDGGDPLTAAAREALAAMEFPATVLEHDDPAEGAARTRNRGLEAARADAVAFLDDDDLWDPGHLAQLSAALDRDPDAQVTYCDARIVNVASGAARTIALDFDLGVFGRDGYIPPTALIARRDAFERFGPFDPEFTYSEDWDWLLRVAKAGGKIVRSRGVSATVRIHAGSMSRPIPERLAERRRCLDLLSRRHGLAPIEPKTFWDVAEALCAGGNASTR